MVPIQIVSDLHLDSSRLWSTYIPPKAPYLALLGDIGTATLRNRKPLADFLLHSCLKKFKAVFYVCGNREAYGSSWSSVRSFFNSFKEEVDSRRLRGEALGEFVLLDQGRYDMDNGEGKVSILGCTLFTQVPPHARAVVQETLNDFKKVKNWTVAHHNAQHAVHLRWLNQQVRELEAAGRRVAIFTHHSPTRDDRAVPAVHRGTDLNTAYCGDLSSERCWKRVYTNQKGYNHENSKSKGFSSGEVVGI
ncbi:hypothetical protein B0T25DRAFT_624283 [Lasiosphaeria hispida]|uniref:Calcineurin-like phosphoesterase domain-containing protein n=1 Tax=Lasiosphaeria hispida TaxID=260671 RepID=A0AAJ0HFI1_9PEZI|nr:hypothetical protein B0T25DRAFT_624283 [Lasiosphaeria hispida]